MRTGNVDDLKQVTPDEVRALLDAKNLRKGGRDFLDPNGGGTGDRKCLTQLEFQTGWRTAIYAVYGQANRESAILGGLLIDQGHPSEPMALACFGADLSPTQAVQVELGRLLLCVGRTKESSINGGRVVFPGGMPRDALCIGIPHQSGSTVGRLMFERSAAYEGAVNVRCGFIVEEMPGRVPVGNDHWEASVPQFPGNPVQGVLLFSGVTKREPPTGD